MPPPLLLALDKNMKKKKITLPTEEDERELKRITQNAKDKIKVRNTTYRIGYMRSGTRDRITSVMLEEGNDAKVSCMVAALIILNGIWKIKFFYPILWRWFYYIRQYRDSELLPLLSLGKKKADVENYYAATTLLIGLKDTMMMMRKEEVSSFLREHGTGQASTQQRNSNG